MEMVIPHRGKLVTNHFKGYLLTETPGSVDTCGGLSRFCPHAGQSYADGQ